MIGYFFNKLSEDNIGLENAIEVSSREYCVVFVVDQSKSETNNFVKKFNLYENSKLLIVNMKHSKISVTHKLLLQCHILHAHHTRAMIIAQFYSLLLGKKLVVTVHNDYNTYKFWQKIIYNIIYACSDKIICNSGNTRSSLPRWLESSEKLIIIHNGVNFQSINALRKSAPKKIHGKIQVLIAARLVPQKNIAFILHCLASIKKDLSYELHIAGSGYLEKELHELVNSLSLQHKVKFLGQLDRRQVITKMHEAHLFLVPSLWEGFCNAMVEAASCDCRIIASDIPVLREVLGGTGTYFKLNDIDSFTSVFERILQELASSDQKISQEGKYVRTVYALSKSAQKHVEAYESLYND